MLKFVTLTPVGPKLIIRCAKNRCQCYLTLNVKKISIEDYCVYLKCKATI